LKLTSLKDDSGLEDPNLRNISGLNDNAVDVASMAGTTCLNFLSSITSRKPKMHMPVPPSQEQSAPGEDWPIPKLRLQVNDLSPAGSALFFANIQPGLALHSAVLAVLKTLYTPQTVPRNVRSVTLFIENMDGVAYTKGSDLDDDHKEIHFSIRHIENNKQRARDEIMGVIVHEMVHCFQFNAKGTCPGGLIEGIADYVRLKAGYVPPHWQRGGDKWDAGYQTTGYFLEFIETNCGAGTVRKINDAMRDKKYDEGIFKDLTGEPVETLWKLYKQSLEK